MSASAGEHGPAGFAAALGGRVALVVLLLCGAILLAASTRLYATSLVLAATGLAGFLDLFALARRPGREAWGFADAVAHDDLSRSFAGVRGVAGLSRRMNEALAALRARSAGSERRTAYLAALVEAAPVALAALPGGGRLEPLNGAGRRLFGDARRLDELAGEPAATLAALAPGRQALVRLDGARYLAAAVGWQAGGEAQTLLSLKDVEHPLGAAETGARSRLVRTLAHEMMNSLTPVASLAEAMAPLVDEAVTGDARAAAELRLAAETVARRAQGLAAFVERYRQVASVPRAEPEPVPAARLGRRLEALFGPALAERGGRLMLDVRPPDLEVSADADLIDQALINLVKNAIEAAPADAAPLVWFNAAAREDGWTSLTVEDAGPGLDEAALADAFVPFFTTKAAGSGIGLSLVQQIALAHGGRVEAGRAAAGGCRFALVLPGRGAA